jgi:Zn ribbon nucleic-acid-binding protein
MRVGLAAVWRDYRNRRRSLLAALAAAPILAATTTLGLPSVPAQASAHHVLLATWATSLVAAVVWFARFRCPHCAERFHWTWLVANPFSRECLHCGFEKWRDPHGGRAYAPAVKDR